MSNFWSRSLLKLEETHRVRLQGFFPPQKRGRMSIRSIGETLETLKRSRLWFPCPVRQPGDVLAEVNRARCFYSAEGDTFYACWSNLSEEAPDSTALVYTALDKDVELWELRRRDVSGRVPRLKRRGACGPRRTHTHTGPRQQTAFVSELHENKQKADCRLMIMTTPQTNKSPELHRSKWGWL